MIWRSLVLSSRSNSSSKPPPLKEGVEFPRTHGVRRLLSILAELTGSDEIKQLLTSYSLELGILEDAYIVSRYFPRSYTGEEFERLRAAVERVRSVVGGVLAS
jgi:HEPN domain-containing protein